jgi:hypothetical protein
MLLNLVVKENSQRSSGWLKAIERYMSSASCTPETSQSVRGWLKALMTAILPAIRITEDTFQVERGWG